MEEEKPLPFQGKRRNRISSKISSRSHSSIPSTPTSSHASYLKTSLPPKNKPQPNREPTIYLDQTQGQTLAQVDLQAQSQAETKTSAQPQPQPHRLQFQAQATPEAEREVETPVCPTCHKRYRNCGVRDMHIFQEHILNLPETPTTPSPLLLNDTGNSSGPLGLHAHIISPTRYIDEEAEEFNSDDDWAIEMWKLKVTLGKVDVGSRDERDEGRCEVRGRGDHGRGEAAEDGEKEENQAGLTTHETALEEEDPTRIWAQISLHDEPPSLHETLRAETLEEEHMFALGFLRYGSSWISTRDVETLDVEDEERRAFGQWTRAAAQSRNAEIVQRFGSMSDDGVDELRELAEEIDDLDDLMGM